MGAILGKSKSVPISQKANGQENEVFTAANHHSDGTTTLERKIKKKKEKISSKKSTDTMVDKFTSTDGSVISPSSSTYIKHLVSGPGYNRSSYDAQITATNHSETPSKDVLELRDACIRRGIFSPETISGTIPTPIEQDVQENTANTVEESTSEVAPAAVVTNDESIPNEQEQPSESNLNEC